MGKEGLRALEGTENAATYEMVSVVSISYLLSYGVRVGSDGCLLFTQTLQPRVGRNGARVRGNEWDSGGKWVWVNARGCPAVNTRHVLYRGECTYVSREEWKDLEWH